MTIDLPTQRALAAAQTNCARCCSGRPERVSVKALRDAIREAGVR